MKHLALSAAFASFAVAAVGQVGPEANQLAPGRSISISAKNVGSAASAVSYWATSWGSYDRDFFTRQDIEIEAHNLSPLPAKVIVDFYFVGQRDYAPAPRKLFSKRTFPIDILPGYLKRISVRSDVLKSNEQRYVALGEQYNSGYHITGWFLEARVPNDKNPLAYASSSPAWIERLDWFRAAVVEFNNEAGMAKKPTAKPRPSTPATTLPSTDHMVSAQASAASSPPPEISYVITTQDVNVKLEYGEVLIRRGTRLRLVKRDSSNAYVNFGNTVLPLALNAVQ